MPRSLCRVKGKTLKAGAGMERVGRVLAGVLLLCALSSTAAQWAMSPSQRDDCTVETQRLYHCATYSSPTTLLTDAQKEMCCEAVSELHISGCFCGWGDAAAMNPWTRDVLVDLASALEACTGGSVSCTTDEEYLLNSPPTVSYTGSAMDALQKASGAVSGIVAQKGWSSSTAGKSSSSSSSSSSGVGGSVQAAGEPLLDLRVVNRLLPSGGSVSGITGDSFGPGDFDLEVEVEQEGGDPEDTAALVSQLMEWMLSLVTTASKGVKGRVEGGNSAALVAAAMMDRMDRSDTLGGILEAITDILGAVLNGTDAQVEVALEITVETTSTGASDPSKPAPDTRSLRGPMQPAPHMTRGFDQRVATEVADSADAHARGHPPCYMHQLYSTVRAQPARFFAVLAAAASLVLLGSFIAQLASLAAREAAQPVQVLRCQVVDNPLLTPELTVPLMDVQGTLSEGYSRGRAGQPPSYVPSS